MNRRQFFSSSVAAGIAAALLPGTARGGLLRALTAVTSGVPALTGTGREIELEKSALAELQASLRGKLLLSGGEAYDRARRVLNPAIDRRPALIVQPVGAADVMQAVTFARERNLLVAIKCGGHSYSGKSTCDGGLQIDLSAMRHVRVDPRRRVARVAGGCLLGDMDHECLPHGLATPTGTVSHTGVGGLTLGGGFGRLARRFGLALDNVRAVDIVTADGTLRRASADENADLYWGVRGGGGNFGVVTSFEFDLHPVPRQVIGGDLVFAAGRAREVLEFYADYSQEAPDELYLDFVLAAPPGGEPGAVLIHACFSGEARDAARVLAPLERLKAPLANTVAAVDYLVLQRAWDESDPRHGGSYMKGSFVTGIQQGLVDSIIEGFEPHPDRATMFYFQQAGGAIGRVAPDATAFPHRDAVNCPGAVASWNPDADPAPHIAWVRAYWKALEPHLQGTYINVTEDGSLPETRRNFGGNFDRLLALKNAYDPSNLFRLNTNIEPTTAG